ncbi:hypothetical protein KCU61_g29, partial [Aureobasidium melanogenum]
MRGLSISSLYSKWKSSVSKSASLSGRETRPKVVVSVGEEDVLFLMCGEVPEDSDTVAEDEEFGNRHGIGDGTMSST